MKRAGALFLAALSALACRDRPPSPASPPAAAPAARDVVLFLGDSLTAGYGVDREEAFPALLGARWSQERLPRRARNAGVSGATSAGVLENLSWSLAPDVAVAVVCVGGNDGLRGADLAAVEKNVDAVVAGAQAAGATVVLAGMRMPPNYGADYAGRFAALYGRVAARRKAAFLPFLLEGVAGKAELNEPDGIHPNAAGHRAVAATVHAFLLKEGLLE